MNSMDGVNNAANLPSGLRLSSDPTGELKHVAKSAEEYVAIENRLAAQRQKPTESAQFTSIFGQLRDQLGDRRS